MSYFKVTRYEGRKGEIRKVVLLYSGGLDTSVMLKWIQDEYKAEVVALTIDIGQQADNLEEIKQKAIKLGAVKALVVDAKSEFAYRYLAKGLKANARYQGDYHLATPLGRPLLAKIAVEVARAENCDCIAHGCTGKGNDQVRLEGTVLTLAPEMKIIAPVREWEMGREEELEYAELHGIPVKQKKDSPYSYDDNMWGISAEGGEIENPSLIPNLPAILQVCSPIEKTPNEPETVRIGFMKGIPVQLDGVDYPFDQIIMKMNTIAARHGVGVVHHIEDRVVGLKVRGVYEAPGAHALIKAHETLEKYVCTAAENEFKLQVDQKWGYLCYRGQWYEPLMDDLNALIDKVNDKVTGVVTLRLFKGGVETIAVSTPNSIFDEKLATFFKSNAFNQNASAGFIEIYTMQMRLSQEKEKYALVSVGGDINKEKFWPLVAELARLGFVLFTTEGTHNYMASKGVQSVQVYKAREQNMKPNLIDLLQQNRFDLVVNVPSPSHDAQEDSDGKMIRQWAAQSSTQIVTDFDILLNTLQRLQSQKKGELRSRHADFVPAVL